MPTGYTADIEKDISFEDFALHCARAFGACASQRDNPKNERPKLMEVDSVYSKWLVEVKEEVETLSAMTPTQRQAYGDKIIKERIDSRQEYFNKKIVLRNKYEAMLEKVKAWNPPTSNHIELKNFMIGQIQQSIDFDCDTRYDLEELTKLSQTTPMKIFTEVLESAKEKVVRYTEEVEKEKVRNAEANSWILDLYKSLNIEYE